MNPIGKALEYFLANDEAKSLLLRGEWGTGKTHLVTSTISELKKNDPNFESIFVSLHDKNSIDELIVALAANVTLKTKISSQLNRLISNFDKFVDRSNIFGKVFVVAAKEMLTGRVIILDDIERRPSDLDLTKVLALIDGLVSFQNCKVLAIMNDDELSIEDQVELNRRTEKIFQLQFKLVPTPEDVAEIAVSGDIEKSEDIKKLLKALGIQNIRIAKEIAKRCEELLQFTTGHSDAFVSDRLCSVCVLTAAHRQLSGFPPLKFVRDTMQNIYLSDKFSEEERSWRRLLDLVGYKSTDELDIFISDSIDHGYFDGDALKNMMKRFKENHRAESSKYMTAWNTYHDTLSEDASAFSLEMFEGAVESAKAISVNNANSTIRLLRLVGSDDLSKKLALKYAELRSEEDPSFFNLENDPFIEKDGIEPEFAKAMEAAYQAKVSSLSVAEILHSINNREPLDHHKIVRLAQLDSDQLIDAIQTHVPNAVSGPITQILSLMRPEEGAPHNVVRKNLRSGLLKLAESSTLNDIRVRRKYLED